MITIKQSLLAVILLLQCSIKCYATHMRSGSSLHERYFHDPYVKLGVQLPINMKIHGYARPVFANTHDKPDFGPFYLISIGNKFKIFQIELEVFHLNLHSKTYMPASIVSSTGFSATGGFINTSLDIIKLERSLLFIGAGGGVSENASHDITWTYSTGNKLTVAQAKRHLKPAFQLFGGISYGVTQNFAIEGVVKYINLSEFTAKSASSSLYQGCFTALTFTINLRCNFGNYKRIVQSKPYYSGRVRIDS